MYRRKSSNGLNLFTGLAVCCVLILILISEGCSKDDEVKADQVDLMIRDLNQSVSADSMSSYVNWLEGMGTRFCFAPNRRQVAERIRKRFVNIGYNNARLDSFYLTRTWHGNDFEGWQYNVIASLEGFEDPDSVSVLGAHYDDILSSGDVMLKVPGANDNASGVAATLEIARVLKSGNFKPTGTIEFVTFAAEELGLHGSWNYAWKASVNKRKLKMMLNNDMIAHENRPNALQWYVNIMNYENSLALSSRAYTMTNRYTMLNALTNNEFSQRSDSWPFAYYGFPSLFFFISDTDNSYHTLFDLPEGCNWIYAREVARISVALLVTYNMNQN